MWFYTNTHCSAELEITSIEEDNDKIMIQLFQLAKRDGFCNDRLYRVDVEFKDEVLATDLDIKMANEYTKQNFLIYP